MHDAELYLLFYKYGTMWGLLQKLQLVIEQEALDDQALDDQQM